MSAGYHPSAELAAEANFERYPAVLEREGASGGAALRHVEQVPGGVALQPYAICPATVCDPPCNRARSALQP